MDISLIPFVGFGHSAADLLGIQLMFSHVAGEEDGDTSFSSDSEDLESQVKTNPSAAAASDYRHSSANCLACCRLRDRKISASSYHRYRTGNL